MRTSGCAHLQILKQFIAHILANILLSLLSRSAYMRGKQYVWHVLKRSIETIPVFFWLNRVNVNGGAAYLFLLNGLLQSIKVHHFSPRVIDQDRPFLELLEGIFIYHVFSARIFRHMKRDHIGLVKDLLK